MSLSTSTLASGARIALEPDTAKLASPSGGSRVHDVPPAIGPTARFHTDSGY